jgi:type II secretory pathway component PulM
MAPVGGTVLPVSSVPSSVPGSYGNGVPSSTQEDSALRQSTRSDTITLSRIATILGQIQQQLEAAKPEELSQVLSSSADSIRAAAQQAGNSAEGNFLENLAMRLQVAANFPGILALPTFSLNSLFAD